MYILNYYDLLWKFFYYICLNLSNIVSEGNNPYQNRPVYLLSNYLIYQILDFFIKDTNPLTTFLPELSYLIVQLIYFVLGE